MHPLYRKKHKQINKYTVCVCVCVCEKAGFLNATVGGKYTTNWASKC